MIKPPSCLKSSVRAVSEKNGPFSSHQSEACKTIGRATADASREVLTEVSNLTIIDSRERKVQHISEVFYSRAK